MPRGRVWGGREQRSRHPRGPVSQTSATARKQWHTRWPSPALPSRLHFLPVSPSVGLGLPAHRLRPPSLSPRFPLSPSLSLLICFLPPPSRRRSFSRPPSLGRSPPRPEPPPPPLPAPPGLPPPAAAPGRPRRRPSPGPRSPAGWRRGPSTLRAGTRRGRRRPPSRRARRPGAARWPGQGAGRLPPHRPPTPSALVPAPGPGPPGARPDGLHREPGVLRGAGARAPLRPPAPGEPPGPGAARALGPRGFRPRRERAAAASGRAPRGDRGGGAGGGGGPSPAHLRQVGSPAGDAPVSPQPGPGPGEGAASGAEVSPGSLASLGGGGCRT